MPADILRADSPRSLRQRTARKLERGAGGHRQWRGTASKHHESRQRLQHDYRRRHSRADLSHPVRRKSDIDELANPRRGQGQWLLAVPTPGCGVFHTTVLSDGVSLRAGHWDTGTLGQRPEGRWKIEDGRRRTDDRSQRATSQMLDVEMLKAESTFESKKQKTENRNWRANG